MDYVEEDCANLAVEELYGFDNDKDAIFALYEELVDSVFIIDKDIVYNALRYLIWSNKMNDKYEEIIEMDPSDIPIITEMQAQKAFLTTISSLKYTSKRP